MRAVDDLEGLIRSHFGLILLETVDEARAERLLRQLADKHGMPFFVWLEHQGLARIDTDGSPILGTSDPLQCLAYIEDVDAPYVFFLRGIQRHFSQATVIARLKEIARLYEAHQGAVIMVAPTDEGPADLQALWTSLPLRGPTQEEYHQYVQALLRDLNERQRIRVDLSGAQVANLLSHIQGMSLPEVRKIITQSVVFDGVLDGEDLQNVLAAKRRIVDQSGVLEYFPCDYGLVDIAGLSYLKGWLQKRKAAFQNPAEARDFGLTPPKGLLLLGVQGCGKSLCAKAVAKEWGLPLVRLDPAGLYQKYIGESEKNFQAAVRLAEQLAPIVLWIDEIEKAFGQDDQDSGTTGRVFATFLSWLQEKEESVFVVATANDISKLPPELLRKGRFDEIFFVDLPNEATRASIFEIHLKKRNRASENLDLIALAKATEGFSGAEIEQVVISALYTSFGTKLPCDEELLLAEARATRPLSVTMSEKIQSLRHWAKDRAVPAN